MTDGISHRNRASTLLRSAWILAAGLAAAIAAVEIVLFFRFTVDDALISLRFARNVATGLGLVYNPGDRVEGFSNPLLVLLEAAAFRAGWDGIIFSKALGLVAYAVILLLLLARVRRRASVDGGFAVLATAAVAIAGASFGLTFYATSGLETVPFGALLLALVLVSSARPTSVAPWLILILVALSRPEGLAYALVPALAAWLERRTEHGDGRRGIIAGLVISGLALCVCLAARWWYYGSLVPNTFYAKMPWTHDVGESTLWPLRGLDDIADFSRAVSLPLLVVTLALGVPHRSLSRPAHLSLATLAIGLLFQKWAGGDWMIGARFLVPLIPIATLIWIETLSRWAHRVTISPALTVAGVCVSLLTLLSHANDSLTFLQTSDFRRAQMSGDVLLPLGMWIHEHVPPEWTLVSGAIGAVGYYGECRIVDWQGLVSRPVSHILATHRNPVEAGTTLRAYIASLAPDVFMNESTNPPAQMVIGKFFYIKVYENRTDTYAAELYVRRDRLGQLRHWPLPAAGERP
jgi:hypothetical protein